VVARRFIAKTKLRLTAFLLLLIITAIAVSQSPGQTQQTQGKSDYAIHSWQDFNRPDFYPISQIPPAKLYQPIADWIGRLILPTKQQLEDGRDWVWLEVQQAPVTQKNLIGKTVRLEWKNNQEILAYIQAITRDVSFTQETIASQTKGMIHPSRLNGVRQVGALRSLAGASPNDDAIVILDNPTVVTASEGKVTLQIEDEPVLATGRFYSLVKIIKPDVKSQHFRVRHYNPSSNNFDGKEEIIRIPQQVIDTRNIPPSTLYQIEKSPAGLLGWYISSCAKIYIHFVIV
jgi:predicted Abi (CAAX) family protease